ncbi:MAG: c-type cytochrome [Deltaproteobacteria bacterium]|nr:c-type cytochrome [Deltaproteobacteria bacterium]
MQQKKWGCSLLMAGSLLLGLPLQEGRAQEKEVAALGRPLYEDNCMACHGHTAKGDGPMVTFGLLTIPATDLTQLSKNNSGHFPFWRMYRIVDGREDVKGHLTRDMPIWGDEFRLDTGSSAMLQAEVRAKILALVYYLQSIQEK